MFKFDKARFVEVWNSTKGKDAAVVESMLKNMFDVRYEHDSTAYTYYRLRATRKEVKLLSNQLEALGYYSVLMDNKYFHIYERAQ